MKNYYDLLGINQDASQEEIDKHFRFLANAYHPDKFPSKNQKELAEEEFKKINEAYQVLSNLAKRSAYDRSEFSGKYQTAPDNSQNDNKQSNYDQNINGNPDRTELQQNKKRKVFVPALVFGVCVGFIIYSNKIPQDLLSVNDIFTVIYSVIIYGLAYSVLIWSWRVVIKNKEGRIKAFSSASGFNSVLLFVIFLILSSFYYERVLPTVKLNKQLNPSTNLTPYIGLLDTKNPSQYPTHMNSTSTAFINPTRPRIHYPVEPWRLPPMPYAELVATDLSNYPPMNELVAQEALFFQFPKLTFISGLPSLDCKSRGGTWDWYTSNQDGGTPVKCWINSQYFWEFYSSNAPTINVQEYFIELAQRKYQIVSNGETQNGIYYLVLEDIKQPQSKIYIEENYYWSFSRPGILLLYVNPNLP